jgi:methyl-accepting chemotaxis protein
LKRAELWEAHTRIVIAELSQLLSSLKDAETGQGGYIITGRLDDLDSYKSSLAKIAPHLNTLRHLPADNAHQQQRLDVVTLLVAARIAELNETIEVRTTRGIEAARAMVVTHIGKNLMDQIRALADQARQEEAQLLVERIGITNAALRDTNRWLLGTAVVGSLTVLILFIGLGRELARRNIEHELRARGHELAEKVDNCTRALHATIDRLESEIDARQLAAKRFPINPAAAVSPSCAPRGRGAGAGGVFILPIPLPYPACRPHPRIATRPMQTPSASSTPKRKRRELGNRRMACRV